MNDEASAPHPSHATLPTPMALLAPMHAFVLDEQRAAQERLAEVWARPLPTKLARGQTQALLRLERGDSADTLQAWLGDNGRAAARAIVADTVERMQGQERELVILSLASGDGLFLSAIADFFFQPERLNVASTRARTKLVIVGPRLDDGVAVEAEHQRMWLDQYRDLIRSSLELEVARRPW